MNVVISLVSPRASVRGHLRNMFLEVQPNLFVGQLGSRQILQLVEIVESFNTIGVMVVSSKRHGFGVRIKQFGQAERKIIDYDGLQLVQRNQ